MRCWRILQQNLIWTKRTRRAFCGPDTEKKNAGPFFFCVFRMSKLPKEHNFSGAFLGSVALFFASRILLPPGKDRWLATRIGLSWPLTKLPFWEWLAIYFHYRVCTAFKIEVIERRLSHCWSVTVVHEVSVTNESVKECMVEGWVSWAVPPFGTTIFIWGDVKGDFCVPAMPGKYKMTQGSTLGIYPVLEWNGWLVYYLPPLKLLPETKISLDDGGCHW